VSELLLATLNTNVSYMSHILLISEMYHFFRAAPANLTARINLPFWFCPMSSLTYRFVSDL
jgi:hypothetical protein